MIIVTVLFLWPINGVRWQKVPGILAFSGARTGDRLVLPRKRFALPWAKERGDSLARLRLMPVQEMRASSAIERVGYNPATRDLSIWFSGNRRYVYANVPAEIYRLLCKAPSAGGFVNSFVKGRFACRCEPPRRRYPH